MEKRGISHIEMLLSFLIFVGFIIFAFYFFSPFGSTRLIESTLGYAQKEIVENTTGEIESYSVSMDLSDAEDQNSIVQIEIEEYDISKNVQARNKNGEIVEAEKVSKGGGVTSKHIKLNTSNVFNIDNPQNSLVIFRFGDGLIENVPVGAGGRNMKGDYAIIASERQKFIFENLILNLVDAYKRNYEGVKKDFNLPNRIDFEFEVVFSADDTIEAKRPLQPESEEMYTEVKRIEVLRNNGGIEFADLKVRVW